MSAAGRYWHTVRHLKPIQLYGRVLFRLARPRIDGRDAPPRRTVSRPWVAPAARPISMTGPDRFRFLNEEHSLSDHGWADSRLPKLWNYNLHYFDDLNALGAESRASWHAPLLTRWVRENSPGAGTAWEPYPTSLRIVNWIKWALAGHSLEPACLTSLAVQARWLGVRLERHLLGNHLFANAKALVFAGLFFEGAEAGGWLARGLRILAQEMPEQVLGDGGQFERSPMYHALAFEDVLDLVNIAAVYGRAVEAQQWRSVAETMQDWLAAMCHPDGEIGFFNDAAIGIAPSPSELFAYAQRLGFRRPAAAAPSLLLADSGFIRLQAGDATVLLDVGPVGPDYLPAHAHADTLSFELSLRERRVFVNSGTSLYAPGPERERQRGTAAHNTVEIDGQNSSEVWGSFRVARRARIRNLSLSTGDPLVARCMHDGYSRLPGRPLHRRTWRLRPDELMIEDGVTARAESSVARFHLHPDVGISETGRDGVRLVVPDVGAVVVTVVDGILAVEDSTWHPGFGLAMPNKCLRVSFQGPLLRTTIRWGAGS